MTRIARTLLAGLVLVALAAPAAAQEVSGVLSARPSATASGLADGVTELPFGAFAYRPESAPPGPRPVIVVLHGSDGKAPRFLDLFRPQADRCGCLMLALQSADWDWDIAAELVRLQEQGFRGQYEPRFGADPPRIDAVLRQFFATAPVDPERVVLMGFSDGAGYSLSLGLANPQLFRAIVALSPGFAKLPDRVGVGQRVFIAHGRNDRRLPFQNTRDMAETLSKTALSVRFRQFKGDHVISRAVVDEALAFALGD